MTSLKVCVCGGEEDVWGREKCAKVKEYVKKKAIM
jgi:hypothetical protein